MSESGDAAVPRHPTTTSLNKLHKLQGGVTIWRDFKKEWGGGYISYGPRDAAFRCTNGPHSVSASPSGSGQLHGVQPEISGSLARARSGRGRHGRHSLS